MPTRGAHSTIGRGWELSNDAVTRPEHLRDVSPQVSVQTDVSAFANEVDDLEFVWGPRIRLNW
uniref:Pyruvate dehydrogenase E1 component n=1 Tax=Streptomyces pratensis (strain ATCC 33331 / IAF-45CD) TaxID=591167 RepID=A0A8D3WNC3_STRFA